MRVVKLPRGRNLLARSDRGRLGALGGLRCRSRSEIFRGSREGGLGLLRDLQDLYPMAAECDVAWTLVGQAAKGLRDEDMLQVVEECESETAIQLKWLRTRMKQAAPQALLVA